MHPSNALVPMVVILDRSIVLSVEVQTEACAMKNILSLMAVHRGKLTFVSDSQSMKQPLPKAVAAGNETSLRA